MLNPIDILRAAQDAAHEDRHNGGVSLIPQMAKTHLQNPADGRRQVGKFGSSVAGESELSAILPDDRSFHLTRDEFRAARERAGNLSWEPSNEYHLYIAREYRAYLNANSGHKYTCLIGRGGA